MARIFKFLGQGNSGNAFTGTAQIVYASPFVNNVQTATEAQATVKAYDAATLSNLLIFGNAAPKVTNPVMRTRNNGANGTQTCTITSGTNAWYEDTTNTDAVTAGNPWAVQLNQSGTMSDGTQVEGVGLHYSVAGSTPLVGAGMGNGLGLSSTNYVSVASVQNISATEANVTANVRHAETYSNFRVSTSTYSATASSQTVRKNSAAGNQTVSVTATGSVEDAVNTDAYTAVTPDTISVQLVNSSSMTIMNFSQVILKGNQTYIPTGTADGGVAISAGSTIFWPWTASVLSNLTSSATEANVQTTARAAFTARNLYLNIPTINVLVGTITLVTRKATASGNVTVAITTTGSDEDTTNSDAIASGNAIDIQTSGGVSGSASPTVINIEMDTSTSVASTLTATAGTYAITGQTTNLTFADYAFVYPARSPNLNVGPMVQRAGAYHFNPYVWNPVLAPITDTNFIFPTYPSNARSNVGPTALRGQRIHYYPERVEPVAYSITAVSGTYAITGGTNNIISARKMTVTTGVYTITGNAVAFAKGFGIVATSGVYATTGNVAALTKQIRMVATSGTYTLTGVTTPLSVGDTHYVAPTYPLIGTRQTGPTPLRQQRIRYYPGTLPPVAYSLTATAGSYTITGQTTALTRQYTMTATAGSYAITGNAVVFTQQHTLTAVSGTYAITGRTTNLVHGYNLTATSGTYAITGRAVALTNGHTLTATRGVYVITGNPATLVAGPVLVATSGVYTLTGRTTGLTSSRRLTATAGSYGITGNAIALTYTAAGAHAYTITAAAGSYGITGRAVTLTAQSGSARPNRGYGRYVPPPQGAAKPLRVVSVGGRALTRLSAQVVPHLVAAAHVQATLGLYAYGQRQIVKPVQGTQDLITHTEAPILRVRVLVGAGAVAMLERGAPTQFNDVADLKALGIDDLLADSGVTEL